jgi:DNA-directed RNA polymerase specialized sigma24 family protein
MRHNTSNRRPTSAAARERVQPHLSRLRGKVYTAVLKAGVRGLTREEIEQRTRIPGNTVRPRVRELIKMKLLVLSSEERCTDSGCNAEVLRARNAK